MKQIFIVLSLLFVMSCDSPTTTDIAENKAGNSIADTANGANISNAGEKNDKEEHDHIAPHGGTLVAFGDEFAHLEFVLDEKTGKLSAYALDGEAENPVRVKQTEIEIGIKKPSVFSVKLNAVENSLTGEKVGDTSEFAAASEQLKNLQAFDATIISINIKGKDFKNVEFNFPKGNEEH